FRIHKTDLQLRPIWHQKQKRVEAHILVCFLAYALWKTLAQLCQRDGLGHEPRKVFEELADITLVDVVLPTRNGVTIRKRCISRATEHQAIQNVEWLVHHGIEQVGAPISSGLYAHPQRRNPLLLH